MDRIRSPFHLFPAKIGSNILFVVDKQIYTWYNV